MERTDGGSVNGGAHPGDPTVVTENDYRQQRNALGDRFLPRNHYNHLPGEAGPGVTDAQLQQQWDNFNNNLAR